MHYDNMAHTRQKKTRFNKPVKDVTPRQGLRDIKIEGTKMTLYTDPTNVIVGEAMVSAFQEAHALALAGLTSEVSE
ncbi:hypothetical protein ACLBV5_09820 [Brevundimonas sp. M1A4_2e]